MDASKASQVHIFEKKTRGVSVLSPNIVKGKAHSEAIRSHYAPIFADICPSESKVSEDADSSLDVLAHCLLCGVFHVVKITGFALFYNRLCSEVARL